jgi:cell wall-associated protease
MQKFIFNLGLFLSFLSLTAQSTSAPKNWYHLDIVQDGFNGVSSLKAYQLMANKPTKTIVVAVIDSGVDIEHEDLKDNIWINTKEIPGNGIDDDGNGYIDDVYGWNFIGSKDGRHVDADNLEATRIVAAWTPMFDGKKANDFKGNDRKRFLDWQRATSKVQSEYASAMQNLTTYTMISQQFTALNELAVSQGIRPVNASNILKIDIGARPELARMKDIAMGFMEGEATLDDLIKMIKEGQDHFSSAVKHHYNVNFDSRKDIVGDNYNDSRERFYGNNDVVGPDALHGTHVAGIIAAIRNNGIGSDGVASNVKIMVLRAVPDGDERDKDVANAIRYAADNGANIINMSFGKAFSWDKDAVDDAVRYAEEKGVLMIHAAGNEATNIDRFPNFPNRRFANGKEAKLWIEVGALAYLKEPDAIADFSNYGRKNVDIFSPGVAIYAPTPGNEYKSLQGTSMAAPVVAGVAAALWSWFPNLSAMQIKNILLNSALPLPGKQNIPENDTDERKKPLVAPLKSVSRTGGVVNLYRAIELAQKVN